MSNYTATSAARELARQMKKVDASPDHTMQGRTVAYIAGRLTYLMNSLDVHNHRAGNNKLNHFYNTDGKFAPPK
jgi:hypothetical protein